MTHYTVKLRNAQHAVQETREWLGDEKFERFVRKLQEGSWRRLRKAGRLRALYFLLGIAGVSGRSVIHAMYRYIWG